MRRTRDAVPGGPFRDAQHASSVEITYVRADAPKGIVLSPIVTYGGATLIAASVAAGAWQAAFFLVALVFGEWLARREARGGDRLTITPDALLVPREQPLLLADVRRVAVDAVADGSAVRVETPDGARLVAHARHAAHARFIADEIDVAYRAHLRRRS